MQGTTKKKKITEQNETLLKQQNVRNKGKKEKIR
jgi:hypothetical protein